MNNVFKITVILLVFSFILLFLLALGSLFGLSAEVYKEPILIGIAISSVVFFTRHPLADVRIGPSTYDYIRKENEQNDSVVEKLIKNNFELKYKVGHFALLKDKTNNTFVRVYFKKEIIKIIVSNRIIPIISINSAIENTSSKLKFCFV